MINILTLNELKELVELTEREDTTWTRWINQATNDVDNLCNGFVLKTFESTTDEYRITKLKYAIANTVEGYDQNARLFGKSGTTVGGGDAPFSLTTQSDNSAIEYKRQDIIKSLVSGGWYKNLAMDLETPLKDELTNEQTTKLVEFLSGLFLRTDGSNEYLADILNFANGGDIINAGNIVAIDDGFEKTITGYKFEPNADSVINKANMIYDPADAEYKFIDKVDKIAFFGKDLNKALTRQETYNLLSASNTLWNAAYSYEEDVAVLYTFTKGGKEFIGQAVSLIDNNMGHNPADGGAFWKLYESTGTTDITEIVDKVIEQVEPTIDNQITTGIDDGLKALPTVNYVSEFAKQTLSFETEADFEAFKTETNTTDADYEDVSGGGTGTGDVTLDTAQTITGIKTFENGIKNNLVEVDGKSLIIKNSKTASSYLEVESVYSGSGYKNWFGIQLFRTTGTSRSRLANVEIRQDDGLYIDSVNDLSFSANNIKFGNARLQGVRTPHTDTDAATKKYADDGLALKQNKLTAGANITITGDTISATGGSTGNFVTLDTAQTVSGVKTFSNRLTINGGLAITGSTSISGGTLNMGSRKIMDLGAPTLDADAATKKYVDDVINSSGGGGGGGTPSNMVTTDTAQTITGIKTFSNGLNTNGATTMDRLRLNGPLNMVFSRIFNVEAPINDGDAATKQYVDTEIAKALKPYKKFIEKLMKEKNYDK